MSLFGFANINFNKQPGNTKGPLRALEGSEFQYSTLRYPLDIGNYDKGHYMVFYIREQNNTSFASSAGNFGNNNSIIDNLSQGRSFENVALVNNTPSDFGGELLSKLNSGLSSLNSATGGALSGITGSLSSGASGLVGGINNLFGQKPTLVSGDAASTKAIIDNSIKKITNNRFLKTTRLTKDAIALYMPDTLQYTYTQSFDELSLGGELGGQALAAGSAGLDAFKEGGTFSAAKSVFKSAGMVGAQKGIEAVGTLTGSSQTAQVAAAALLGAVQNPLLEMIYKSPSFRSFQFDFMFYPRDEKEAYEVQQIIEKMRFHQAPEFSKDTQGFLIPPSEFDIRFYYGGSQNPNIPSIATCVLTTINVNYAPNGFSAYEIPGESAPALGRTGMPVAIQMTLEFKETIYLTKADFKSDKSKMQEYTRASQSGEYGPS
jgi:hypothetical protein